VYPEVGVRDAHHAVDVGLAADRVLDGPVAVQGRGLLHAGYLRYDVQVPPVEDREYLAAAPRVRCGVDLDGGGGGANELKDWISGDEDPPELKPHTWVPEESGVATSIFHTTAASLVGREVILPVFNKVCEGLPTISDPETLEQCNAGSIDDQSLITSSTLNFHLISFSAFHVACVQTGKNKVTVEDGYFIHASDKDCYGHEKAVSLNLIDENDKSIEGYFVRLDLGGYGSPGDWFDTGTFTVVLIP